MSSGRVRRTCRGVRRVVPASAAGILAVGANSAGGVPGFVFLFAIAGGDLFRGHRQPGQPGRGAAGDDLAQQQDHGVLRVIGQRPVQRDVGERAVAGLPGDEGEQRRRGRDVPTAGALARWDDAVLVLGWSGPFVVLGGVAVLFAPMVGGHELTSLRPAIALMAPRAKSPTAKGAGIRQWARPRSVAGIQTTTSMTTPAAREYSLIRPPRTGFRWIRPRSRSATVRWSPSCPPPGTLMRAYKCRHRLCRADVIGKLRRR
jgi:hypothetical protein